jgi:hypothetical protein
MHYRAASATIVALSLGLLGAGSATASTPPTTPGGTAAAPAPPAAGRFATVISTPAASLPADQRRLVVDHLQLDQSDMAAFLSGVGAPSFTPVITDGTVASISTGHDYNDTVEITWALAPADGKAVFDAVVTVYTGEWSSPTAVDEGVTFPYNTVKVAVAASDKVTLIAIDVYADVAKDAPAVPLPQALLTAVGTALDAASSNAALTQTAWDYRLGSRMFLISGDPETPRWSVTYQAAAGTKAMDIAKALCGAAGAEEDNSFVRCVDAGRNGNPNVQVSTDFDDPTLADTVRVLSPY